MLNLMKMLKLEYDAYLWHIACKYIYLLLPVFVFLCWLLVKVVQRKEILSRQTDKENEKLK